jgi:hypothetical protein
VGGATPHKMLGRESRKIPPVGGLRLQRRSHFMGAPPPNPWSSPVLTTAVYEKAKYLASASRTYGGGPPLRRLGPTDSRSGAATLGSQG